MGVITKMKDGVIIHGGDEVEIEQDGKRKTVKYGGVNQRLDGSGNFVVRDDGELILVDEIYY